MTETVTGGSFKLALPVEGRVKFVENLIVPYIHRLIFRDERIVRELLSRWVSELEPAIVYDSNGNLLGLTVADTPEGVKPFILGL